jgi:septal ring factor EnvC (AmiA/AmiB activator)
MPSATSPAPAQPTISVQDGQQDIALPPVMLSAEQARLLETMPRNLADLEQRIEELKASQELMARDNAKAVAELKASQDQLAEMSNEIAKGVAELQTRMARIANANAKSNVELKASQEKVSGPIAIEDRSARRRIARGMRIAPSHAATQAVDLIQSPLEMMVPEVRLPPSFWLRPAAPGF